MTVQRGLNPLDLAIIGAGKIAAVHTATTATDVPVVCPKNGNWTGVVVNFDTILATAADADQVFDAYVNDADSGVNFTIAEGAAADTGHFMGPSAELGVREGDLLELRSGGQQIAATVGYFNFHIR